MSAVFRALAMAVECFAAFDTCELAVSLHSLFLAIYQLECPTETCNVEVVNECLATSIETIERYRYERMGGRTRGTGSLAVCFQSEE